MPLWLVVVAVTILLPSRVVAGEPQQVGVGQAGGSDTTETNRAPIIPFLEGTDVFWTLVKKDALDAGASWFPNKLEANIFPHLVFYQNFTDILDIDRQTQRAAGQGKGVKEIAMAFSGTPAVRIRMLRDRSAPVRTPSYMPRGNFQFLWVRGLKDGAPESERDQPRGPAKFLSELRRVPRVSIWEAHVIAGHHSNGQDGCLSTDQELVPPLPAKDGVCLPEGLVPTAETMNRIDGSFSSAFFFRFGGNFSRNWMPKAPPAAATEAASPAANAAAVLTDVQAIREIRASVEWEWHPRKLVDDQMRDIYGRNRLNLGGAYALRGASGCQRRLEISGGFIWNPGVIDDSLQASGYAQVSCFPWDNGGWGFFARWYAGQDYYNVGFLDDINRLQVGLTFNQADFFRFRKRRAPAQ
jgi:hypothetical protein